MTLGTTTTGNFALTSADGGAYGLFGGVSNSGRAWLQAGRYDNNIAYDLILQASGGNVGIGTTNPGSYKLAVEGKIGAREINVTTAAWSDYVFENTYKLRPLSQVESFIKENKHLPEVPSATEVKANGINLGEMDALLLKKIEELTLYVIEQQKEIKDLKTEVTILKSNSK